MHVRSAFFGPAWLLVALVVLAAGCRPSAERFTPRDEVARKSLVAALEAWKKGTPAGTIDDVSPAVQVVDTERQPGQSLVDYQVLTEAASTSGRSYVVRVQLRDPAAEERVRFVVVGIDPIWVFRKADFDRLTHWEHPMTEPEPAEETLTSQPAPQP